MMTDSNLFSLSCFLERRHGVRAWVGTCSKRDLDGYRESLSTLVRLRPPSFPSPSHSHIDKIVLFSVMTARRAAGIGIRVFSFGHRTRVHHSTRTSQGEDESRSHPPRRHSFIPFCILIRSLPYPCCCYLQGVLTHPQHRGGPADPHNASLTHPPIICRRDARMYFQILL